MTTYRITSPHFVAAIVSSGDDIVQAAPILHWTVGKSVSYVTDYCKARGWQVEPMIEDSRPCWLEVEGQVYEIHWSLSGVITRITRHDGDEPHDLTFDELPEQLKRVI